MELPASRPIADPRLRRGRKFAGGFQGLEREEQDEGRIVVLLGWGEPDARAGGQRNQKVKLPRFILRVNAT